MMGYIFKFQIGYEPSIRGTLEEWGAEGTKVGAQVAEGLYQIDFDDPEVVSYFYLETIPYAMQKYASEINEQLYDSLNESDLENPDED
ncbi:hypothetical protein B7486_45745 [cyanobacterium TDX16]|nr:hypothetical protein B7486_45745 [cyanobacterium TDX16]